MTWSSFNSDRFPSSYGEGRCWPQGPAHASAAPERAWQSLVTEAEGCQAAAHGLCRDHEQLSQLGQVLFAAAPGPHDEAFGHEQAGGEVVGDSFPGAVVGVEQVTQWVVDDVLELMGQGEALANHRFGPVAFQAPGRAGPVGDTRGW